MTASDYRAIAREKLTGKWGTAILATLAAFYLGGLLVTYNVNVDLKLDEDTQLQITSLLYLPITFLGLGGLLSIVQFILGGVIRQGYCSHLLKNYDGQEADVKDVFSQFHRFGDGFCLYLLEGLYTFLWMLLLIIPGIIASYRYAMAPFIMAENEDMTASEAINASKELMEGHKWELFCLDFSFLGWDLLNILTFGIGSLFLNPYANTARAAFYRNLCPKVEPQPVVEYLPETPAE